MPYKNPQKKQAWERHHRQQRLARRRELRQIAVVQAAANPTPDGSSASLVVLPFLASVSLAVYSPDLAMVAGGGTLLVAMFYKKSWIWWLLGAFTLVLAIFFGSSARPDLSGN